MKKKPKRRMAGNSLRDGACAVAARMARRQAEQKGHMLFRFRASKDNADIDNSGGNKLGDTFGTECRFCKKSVVLSFEPFDTDEAYETCQTAKSDRFGHHSERKFVVTGLNDFCPASGYGTCRIVLVKAEPFVLKIPKGTTDKEILEILEMMTEHPNLGASGWDEITDHRFNTKYLNGCYEIVNMTDQIP